MLTKNDLTQIKGLIKDSLDDKTVEIMTKMTDFKSEILDAVDAVMGEVKAGREEQTIISGKISEHSDTLENHEVRICAVEKKVTLLSP